MLAGRFPSWSKKKCSQSAGRVLNTSEAISGTWGDEADSSHSDLNRTNAAVIKQEQLQHKAMERAADVL